MRLRMKSTSWGVPGSWVTGGIMGSGWANRTPMVEW